MITVSFKLYYTSVEMFFLPVTKIIILFLAIRQNDYFLLVKIEF